MARPTIYADLDGDGLPDLVLGEGIGEFRTYINMPEPGTTWPLMIGSVAWLSSWGGVEDGSANTMGVRGESKRKRVSRKSSADCIFGFEIYTILENSSCDVENYGELEGHPATMASAVMRGKSQQKQPRIEECRRTGKSSNLYQIPIGRVPHSMT